MYVHEIRKDTAEDADLYEELRDAWDGVGYAGLPSFDDVLPDILEWVRGIRVADTVFNDYTYRGSRLLYFDGEVSDAMLGGAVRDAVFEAWRDDADPVSGDMYLDMEKLPGYIETAKGGKRNA